MKLPQRFKQPGLITTEVEQLIEQLQGKLALAKPNAKDVHEIRVSCKKLRSWIRLLREHAAAAGHWQQADKTLRKIARKFAPSRDATVLQQTVRKLQTRTQSQRRRTACSKVLRELKKRPPATASGSKPRLPDKIVQHLVSGTTPTAAVLRQGLQLTHQRSEHLALAAISGTSSIKRLHRLRRWLKYLRYQQELASLPTAAGRKLALQLSALGHTLGQLHDLSELQQQLEQLLAADPSLRAVMTAYVGQQCSKLIRQATVDTCVLFGL